MLSMLMQKYGNFSKYKIFAAVDPGIFRYLCGMTLILGL